jgi:hypothetical protein
MINEGFIIINIFFGLAILSGIMSTISAIKLHKKGYTFNGLLLKEDKIRIKRILLNDATTDYVKVELRKMKLFQNISNIILICGLFFIFYCVLFK